MIDWSTCPAVESRAGVYSGAWVFRGTRVPVAALFENLEGGASVSEFVEWFPGVTLEQVKTVLEHVAHGSLAPAQMYVLFDQGTPAPLRSFLPGHRVETAHECGWGQIENGDLLSAAEAGGFEVLVTTDQNLRYQQNLSGRRISVVVLSTTNWPRIRPAAQAVAAAMGGLPPGSYVEVKIP